MLWKTSPRTAEDSDSITLKIAVLERDIQALQSRVSSNRATIVRVHERIDEIAVKVYHVAGFITALSLTITIVGYFIK